MALRDIAPDNRVRCDICMIYDSRSGRLYYHDEKNGILLTSVKWIDNIDVCIYSGFKVLGKYK